MRQTYYACTTYSWNDIKKKKKKNKQTNKQTNFNLALNSFFRIAKSAIL